MPKKFDIKRNRKFLSKLYDRIEHESRLRTCTYFDVM